MPNDELREITEQIYTLSDEYFKCSIEAGEIAERAAVAWLELRRDYKTNAETDKVWHTTADGRREQYLKYFLKGAEKRLSALRMKARLLTGQGA